MDVLLGNEGLIFRGISVIGNDAFATQVILPQVNFTCSGNVLSWVFGAQWDEHAASLPELQIWRPGSEDGSYTKVGSTTIMVERNTTEFYEYRPSSPLAFQAGDVLGYYHPVLTRSRLRLLIEGLGRGVEHQLGYYYATDSPERELNISGPGNDRSTVFINVVTGE